MPPEHSSVADTVEYDDILSAIEGFQERGWTDGLPIVPPTAERVRHFVDFVARPPDEVVLSMPSLGRSCTVEKAAVNAVMAGCRAEYFPVLLAALECGADSGWPNPTFYSLLHASTTGQASFMVVNGPVRNEIGINCGVGILGPGHRANMTIGRAFRLVLINVFGFVTGVRDQGTHGCSAKIASLIGENEEASPWAPFHTDRGFAASDSTVTLLQARGSFPVELHLAKVPREPEHVLDAVADVMSSLALMSSPAVQRRKALILGIEHAWAIAQRGWSKQDVKQYLCERAKRPRTEWDRINSAGDPTAAASREEWSRRDDGMVHLVRLVDGVEYIVEHTTPDDVLLFVSGGDNSGVSTVVPLGIGRLNPFGTVIENGGVPTNLIRRSAEPGTGPVTDQSRIDEALRPLEESLRVNGFHLDAVLIDRDLQLSILANPDACPDCLAPLGLLSAIVADALAGASITVGTVRIVGPVLS
jgi:hypothetical protein